MIENINVSLAGVVSRARTIRSEASGGKGALISSSSRLSHCGGHATALGLSLVQSGGQMMRCFAREMGILPLDRAPDLEIHYSWCHGASGVQTRITLLRQICCTRLFQDPEIK